MLDRPTLKREDLPYREAFFILNGARTSGMSSANPLAVSEILGLVNMGGIAYIGDKPKYLRLIQKLDSTYLTHQAEKAVKP
jgi:hypothetical protein